MTHKYARKDDNHDVVKNTLIMAGWVVLDTHDLGNGAPDLIASKNGRTVAIEIKDWDKPPCRQKLTEDEEAFRLSWQGEYALIKTKQHMRELTGIEQVWEGGPLQKSKKKGTSGNT